MSSFLVSEEKETKQKKKKGKGTLGPSVYRRINSFRWPLFTNSRSVGRSAENKRGAHAIRKRKKKNIKIAFPFRRCHVGRKARKVTDR